MFPRLAAGGFREGGVFRGSGGSKRQRTVRRTWKVGIAGGSVSSGISGNRMLSTRRHVGGWVVAESLEGRRLMSTLPTIDDAAVDYRAPRSAASVPDLFQ